MCIPYDEAFPFIPKFLTLTVTWPLTNISENFIYAISFELLEVVLSYFTWPFLVMRPFHSFPNFGPCDLDRDLWPTYLNILSFAVSFEPLEAGLLYFTFTFTFFVIISFCSYQKFWHCDLHCDLWPTYLRIFTCAVTFEPLKVVRSYVHSL